MKSLPVLEYISGEEILLELVNWDQLAAGEETFSRPFIASYNDMFKEFFRTKKTILQTTNSH